jgi:hypothetical protein
MPPKNKYELRSQEVQEVLSTPPRFLTHWGTALVIVVLLAGIFILSQYKIAQTIKVPAEVIETNGKLVVMIDSALAIPITLGQPLKIISKMGTITIEGSIAQIIDTTINMGAKKFLLLSENSSNIFPGKLSLAAGMKGEAEIQIAKQSLLQLFNFKR